MSRRQTGMNRREFGVKVEQCTEEMSRKENELELYASDLDQERRTLESLDLQGAQEDAEQIENAILHAEGATAEKFDSENEHLERIQGENENLERDFSERQKSAESDLTKIAEAKIESSEAVNAMQEAEEAAGAAREFLRELIERTSKAKDESEQKQKALEDQVRSIRERW